MYYPNTVLCQGFLAQWRIFLLQRKANWGKAITSLQFLWEPSKNAVLWRQALRQIMAEWHVTENCLSHSAIIFALKKSNNLAYSAIISPLEKAENITRLLIKYPLEISILSQIFQNQEFIYFSVWIFFHIDIFHESSQKNRFTKVMSGAISVLQQNDCYLAILVTFTGKLKTLEPFELGSNATPFRNPEKKCHMMILRALS